MTEEATYSYTSELTVTCSCGLPMRMVPDVDDYERTIICPNCATAYSVQMEIHVLDVTHPTPEVAPT